MVGALGVDAGRARRRELNDTWTALPIFLGQPWRVLYAHRNKQAVRARDPMPPAAPSGITVHDSMVL